MSVDDLVKELRSAKTFDIVDARAKVEIAFDAATSFEERGQVLAVFKAIMDEGERQLISTQGNQSQLLAAFRTARAGRSVRRARNAVLQHPRPLSFVENDPRSCGRRLSHDW